jgi:hypothetical protein|nr:MAG TPA: hypothetical protein [Caudoviricetes sp.]
MEKKFKDRDWSDILTSWDIMNSMRCSPDYPELAEGTVIDEEKSVRWNKEEVERRNALRVQEIIDLKNEKDSVKNSLEEEIVCKFAKEYSVHIESVKKIYSYAFLQDHAYGIRDVINTTESLIELFKDIIS